MKLKVKSSFFAIMFGFLFIPFTSIAATISPASDWSSDITLLVNRNSPEPTTSITDISGGVLLEYSAATGGINVGTSTWQYDFTTIAASSGNLFFDISADVIIGTFNNTFSLSILKNDTVVETLFSTTQNTANEIFTDNLLSLIAGDIWGIRVVTGNFSLSTGTHGAIQVTSAVPIPAAIWLFVSGLGLLGLVSRSKMA